LESLIGDLLDNYLRQAWVFSVLHLLFLLYFLYRWRQNWHQVGALLQALDDDTRESDLLKYARDQISRYAGQGREPDLPRIERYIAGRFDRGPDTIQPLVNIFVIIGLMGTLFTLFTLGHQSQEMKDPKLILSRMGVAFSTSFFGVIWAMVCSVAFLTPLRRRTNSAIQEIGRRLTELSAEYEPKSPERAFEELARTLRENVTAFGLEVTKMSEREEAHMAATRAIITEFSAKTRLMLSGLSNKVEETQSRMERTTAALKEAVTESLDSIKENFVQISQTWREELKQTIESSETAAANLSISSEQLTSATKEVAGSLKSVHDSLERTKNLGRIAADVERLTQDYLRQSGKQLDTFKKGLDDILETSRTVPHEWFTMLTLAGDRLAEQWAKITDGWQTHVTDTGDLLMTRLGLINDNLEPVSKLLSHDGELAAALNDFRVAVAEVRELLAERATVESQTPPAVMPELAESLPASLLDDGGGQGMRASEMSNGWGDLAVTVEGIHTLLGDFFSRFGGRAESYATQAATTQPARPAAPTGEEMAQPVETLPMSKESRPPEDSPPELTPVETQCVENYAVESQPVQPMPVEQPQDGGSFTEEAVVSQPGEGDSNEPIDEHRRENLDDSARPPGEQRAAQGQADWGDTYRDDTDKEGLTQKDVGSNEDEPETIDLKVIEAEELITEGPPGNDEGEVKDGEAEAKKVSGWRKFFMRFFKRRDADDNREVT
jgi:hypothetical protein